ncbi:MULTISPECIES: Fpg/Nei family DNA glycosylase [Acidobacteriaceae]|uniref:Fpg/Nei family DNA glycosylase n=1 Tax=Acidobacteriaceae TaxID=204434 RepID=UPI00131AAE5F|nr:MULTISPECIES: DNA-formamidopyrimidine glycosylase family protein [Acidobacteriaceae]MDW5265093.1 DNA-formamidopyrimidine glycosylase family protein [Edaphobacter sp.]
MPEGDTIYRAARALQRAIGGKVVTRFETGLAKLARVNDDAPLVGRVVEKVQSRGKWLLIYFSGDLILVTHMLMSGSWHLYRSGERWRMGRTRMRVVIRTVDWEAVAFNVPIAEFHTARSLERSSQVPKLGPDILAGEFTVAGGLDRLAAYGRQNPNAEIGVVLLNQRVLAGLGNVYKSEVAFAAGVNPFRAMRTITPKELEAMVDFAQRYMKANVADGKGDGIVTYSGNRRTTHAMNREERLWVYRRQGQDCRRCGATVMMRRQGEQARSTYWCSECQPWVEERVGLSID